MTWALSPRIKATFLFESSLSEKELLVIWSIKIFWPFSLLVQGNTLAKTRSCVFLYTSPVLWSELHPILEAELLILNF